MTENVVLLNRIYFDQDSYSFEIKKKVMVWKDTSANNNAKLSLSFGHQTA